MEEPCANRGMLLIGHFDDLLEGRDRDERARTKVRAGDPADRTLRLPFRRS
jgi:hypothetical protein